MTAMKIGCRSWLPMILLIALASTAKAGSLEETLKTAKQLCEGKKYKEAIPLLNEAADSGSVEGQFLLGKLLMEGKGVEKDETVAVAWLKRAASHDYADAHFHLGLAYLKGKGVAKDEYEAAKHFYKARDLGYSKVQKYFDDLDENYDFGWRISRMRTAEDKMAASCVIMQSYVVGVTTVEQCLKDVGFACATKYGGVGIISMHHNVIIGQGTYTDTVFFGYCPDAWTSTAAYHIEEGFKFLLGNGKDDFVYGQPYNRPTGSEITKPVCRLVFVAGLLQSINWMESCTAGEK